MNSKESSNHYKMEDNVHYREGVVVDRPTKDDSSWVEIGLKQVTRFSY
jgi:predicted SPOUT superfamily RNA methylase MTH1